MRAMFAARFDVSTFFVKEKCARGSNAGFSCARGENPRGLSRGSDARSFTGIAIKNNARPRDSLLILITYHPRRRSMRFRAMRRLQLLRYGFSARRRADVLDIGARNSSSFARSNRAKPMNIVPQCVATNNIV